MSFHEAIQRLADKIPNGNLLAETNPETFVLAVADEIDRLQAIEGRLPKTADGVPITVGMHLWLPGECYSIIALHFSEPVEREEGVFVVKINTYRGWGWADCFYSTRETAEKARLK